MVFKELITNLFSDISSPKNTALPDNYKSILSKPSGYLTALAVPVLVSVIACGNGEISAYPTSTTEPLQEEPYKLERLSFTEPKDDTLIIGIPGLEAVRYDNGTLWKILDDYILEANPDSKGILGGTYSYNDETGDLTYRHKNPNGTIFRDDNTIFNQLFRQERDRIERLKETAIQINPELTYFGTLINGDYISVLYHIEGTPIGVQFVSNESGYLRANIGIVNDMKITDSVLGLTDVLIFKYSLLSMEAENGDEITSASNSIRGDLEITEEIQAIFDELKDNTKILDLLSRTIIEI